MWYLASFPEFFAKMATGFLVPDQKAERLAHLIVNKVVPFYGVPEALLSDHGTN